MDEAFLVRCAVESRRLALVLIVLLVGCSGDRNSERAEAVGAAQNEPDSPTPTPTPALMPPPESLSLERKTVTLQKTGEAGAPGISYPEVKLTANPELRDRIQEAVGLKAGTGKSLDEWQADYEGLSSIDYEVHYNDRSLLSITYELEGAGAGPWASSRDLVVDLKTGRRLAASDLFKKDQLPALAAKLDVTLQGEIEEIRRKWSEETGLDWSQAGVEDDWSFQVKDLDNFSLDGHGVTFSMEFGLPSLKKDLEPSGRYILSFEDLSPYIDWDGPLSRFSD